MQKKILIIGASSNPEKFGNKAVRAYQQAGYKVYPVNPHETNIEGLTCYARIEEVPEKVELASLYLPAHVSLGLVASLVAKGVKEVYVNPGAESDELLETLEKAGIKSIQACSIVALQH